jgi:hypothetical protein
VTGHRCPVEAFEIRVPDHRIEDCPME